MFIIFYTELINVTQKKQRTKASLSRRICRRKRMFSPFIFPDFAAVWHYQYLFIRNKVFCYYVKQRLKEVSLTFVRLFICGTLTVTFSNEKTKQHFYSSLRNFKMFYNDLYKDLPRTSVILYFDPFSHFIALK